MSVTVVYTLTFNREMMNRPILHTLGHKFRLTLTLRRAMLSEDGGWAEVAFTGAPEETNRALAELQTTGVTTTGPIEVTQLVESEGHAVGAVGRGT